MVSLLLIISFLLHTVLLMTVYYLHQQLQQTKRSRKKEIESLFENFLQEIKQENELLQHQLVERHKNTNTNSVYTPPKEERINVSPKPLKHHYKIDLQALHEEKRDELETSVEGQVFQLYREGKSIEEIARELHRGKTEIELMIKLHENKGRKS